MGGEVAAAQGKLSMEASAWDTEEFNNTQILIKPSRVYISRGI